MPKKTENHANRNRASSPSPLNQVAAINAVDGVPRMSNYKKRDEKRRRKKARQVFNYRALTRNATIELTDVRAIGGIVGREWGGGGQ